MSASATASSSSSSSSSCDYYLLNVEKKFGVGQQTQYWLAEKNEHSSKN